MFSSPFAAFLDTLNDAPRYPKVSLGETPESILLQADVPGLTAKDIQVELKDRHLHLRGSRKDTLENVYHEERNYGEFHRCFHLSSKVDPEKIQASVKDGVLTVTLLKLEKNPSRSIVVKQE